MNRRSLLGWLAGLVAGWRVCPVAATTRAAALPTLPMFTITNHYTLNTALDGPDASYAAAGEANWVILRISGLAYRHAPHERLYTTRCVLWSRELSQLADMLVWLVETLELSAAQQSSARLMWDEYVRPVADVPPYYAAARARFAAALAITGEI